MEINGRHHQRKDAVTGRTGRVLALLLFLVRPEDSDFATGPAAGFDERWTATLKAIFWIAAALLSTFAIARLH